MNSKEENEKENKKEKENENEKDNLFLNNHVKIIK